MEIGAIASLASDMSQERTVQAVQLTVLKKAMDIAAGSALQLLQALPAPPAVNNPPHLGQSIDTSA